MLVINSIDKVNLRSDSFYSGESNSWTAKLFLFMGFALMAGGLAGSVVCPFPPMKASSGMFVG
jgi:Uncharacterised protein family (UPF0220)